MIENQLGTYFFVVITETSLPCDRGDYLVLHLSCIYIIVNHLFLGLGIIESMLF